ncbi:hypothetical protein PHYPO_G00042020 [Pangasianodon hypophthalmus]|uniref:Uncharacterized protein n=1 Tax=Pangasianodon hypophthalmus TaxID=310915 RepID=A0A5N5MHF6_PANHP|nr:hypothetical protein PHYPO_G00042020 [Pangasianodon hypophthalmus]
MSPIPHHSIPQSLTPCLPSYTDHALPLLHIRATSANRGSCKSVPLGKRLWGVFIKPYGDEQQLALSVSPGRRGGERERGERERTTGAVDFVPISTLLESVASP